MLRPAQMVLSALRSPCVALDQGRSSTWREAKTIESGLDAFKERLRGSMVLWYSDNMATTSLARKGSMKRDLNPIAENITDICEQSDIDLQVKWLRRNKNMIADKLSRFIDLDDWGISPHLLERLQNTWCTADVDRFATEKNAKLKCYISHFNCPGTEAIDSFVQNWAGVVNLLVPPPQLNPQTLQHLVKCRAKGILVVPFWKANKFWPFLFSWKGPRYPIMDWQK